MNKHYYHLFAKAQTCVWVGQVTRWIMAATLKGRV